MMTPALRDALLEARTQHGEVLQALAERGPLLLVFLRHFGCALCREMVADVARDRAAITARGTHIVFVHMHAEALADTYFAEYGLADVRRVADPGRRLYAAFGFDRVGPAHWLSWRVLRRYIDAIFRRGHRPGYVGGDVLQMPGAIVLRDGGIARSFRPDTLADRFDAIALVS